MTEHELLADRFQEHRDHLRAVAYRMLGSLTEADDAVQEAWLRLARTESADIGNLGGWLTTVVGRVCLDMLRARKIRHEEPLETDHLPDPVIAADTGSDPEQQALLADSVGMALLVVLESLRPVERLAFVLHDMFALPFDQIAPIIDRTPQTAKKLASQARRHVQGRAAAPDPDLSRQRRVVDAFLTAAREGDFDALLGILDPDIVLRADPGLPGMRVLRGATDVAGLLDTFHRMATTCTSYPALVNGTAGLVSTREGALFSIMSFTVTDARITTIDILSDPHRLDRIDATAIIGRSAPA
ncbi:sigma-70 family RNA polymerase sigma factor [Nocardia mexicana]|uniref:RNA polymerase sigma-70 factor (ECF subfamily) n=1 Tax=Nocardia mexicana TaxID=279262 RepID=A0A370HEQ6_9NOCA|nr:sigma-70 family RNA polymerase sigma factor [Nocardia mexicana]RDI53373.1 RNA polymerase sigma-70 factor (ECF subfamily) [Nocardia mexicana]